MDAPRDPPPPGTPDAPSAAPGASIPAGAPGTAGPAAPPPHAAAHGPSGHAAPAGIGPGGWIPLLGAAIPVAVFVIGLLEHRLAPREALPTPATVAAAPAPSTRPPSTAVAAPPGELQRTSTDFLPQPSAWDRLLAANPAPASTGGDAAPAAPAATAACVACHGAGVPAGGQPIPRIAGLQPEYLAKQLVDYRGGSRSHPLMTPVARGLSDADIAALARYYGALPGPAPARTGPARAVALQTVGDNALALPACANCHGRAGTGEGNLLPYLAGQPADYLSAQINAFRAGTRRNDDGAVMRAIAQRLSDADVAALGQYYASAREDAAPAPAPSPASVPASGAAQAPAPAAGAAPASGAPRNRP